MADGAPTAGSSEPLVVESVVEGVATLRLNRPAKRNAMHRALSLALQRAVARADADPAVAAIVITGGPGIFCAGADMTEALAAYAEHGRAAVEGGDAGEGAGSESGGALANPVGDAAHRIQYSPKPTIAAVDGPAYGGGAVLALACDIRLVTERGRFRFPGAENGLIVAPVALTRLVGPAVAKELLFSSRTVEAEEAVRLGLANRLVAAEALEAALEELTGAIVRSSAQAIGWLKRVVDATAAGTDARAIEEQADRMTRGSADNLERFRAATERVTGRSAGGSPSGEKG
jgi:enoyl-CoA hydratase/carnithine racemase